MVETYTRPELSTGRGLARRQIAKVAAAGGCAYCTHRVSGWGRHACESTGRTFPLCLKTPGTSFDPDHDKLRSNQ